MFFLQIFFVRVFKISAHILIQDVIVVRVSERFIYSGRCGVSFCTFIRTQTTHKIGPVYIFLNSINPLFFPHRKLLCERVNVLPLNFFFLCHSFSEPDATHFFSTFIARQSNWIAVALIYQDLHKWMYIQIWYILNSLLITISITGKKWLPSAPRFYHLELWQSINRKQT